MSLHSEIDADFNATPTMSNLSSVAHLEDATAMWSELGVFKEELSKRLQETSRALSAKRLARCGTKEMDEARRGVAQAIACPVNLDGFKRTHISRLNDFLYSLDLMVDCRIAALRVSKSAWLEIQGRIF